MTPRHLFAVIAGAISAAIASVLVLEYFEIEYASAIAGGIGGAVGGAIGSGGRSRD